MVPAGRARPRQSPLRLRRQTATTIDQVLPRSRDGRNTWLNPVAACGGCNQRKGDRTPAEAGMTMRIKPAAPTWAALAAR